MTRRHVSVDGVRVRTVDVHAHCAVPEAVALFEAATTAKIPLPDTLLLSSAARLEAMDEQGIDVEALSINPFWYGAERELAQELITTQNERLAEVCASEPERFVAFATVALQHPDLAAAQLDEACGATDHVSCDRGQRRGRSLPNTIPPVGQAEVARWSSSTTRVRRNHAAGRLRGMDCSNNVIGIRSIRRSPGRTDLRGTPRT